MLRSKDTVVPVDQAHFPAETDLQSPVISRAAYFVRLCGGQASVETQRKAGREELLTRFEAQREGCLVGQAKSHPLPFKLGLPSVTQPRIFLI